MQQTRSPECPFEHLCQDVKGLTVKNDVQQNNKVIKPQTNLAAKKNEVTQNQSKITTPIIASNLEMFGQGCLLSKLDIQNLLSIIHVNEKTGNIWVILSKMNTIMTKLCPKDSVIFVPCTSLHWIIENKLKIPGCAHISDDFYLLALRNMMCVL